MLVENLHRRLLDVKVARDAPSFRLVQLSAPLVEPHHLGAIERPRRLADQLPPVLRKIRVHSRLFPRQAVRQRVLLHSRVQVRVPQPLRPLAHVRHRSQHHLGIEVIRQVGDELRLNRGGVRQQREVVREFFMLGDDDALAGGVESRPTRSAENLLHVQDA